MWCHGSLKKKGIINYITCSKERELKERKGEGTEEEKGKEVGEER